MGAARIAEGQVGAGGAEAMEHAVILPDRTVFLTIPLERAKARRGETPDRIESEGDEFVATVDDAYRQLAAIFANRFLVVDGSEEPERIASMIRGQLRDLS